MEAEPIKEIGASLLIRDLEPANPIELDRLWELNCQSFEKVSTEYDINDPAQKRRFTEGLINTSNNSKSAVIVGLVNDRIVGLEAMQPINDQEVELFRLRVDPNFKRKGIATKMTDNILRRAKLVGYTKISLGTSSERLKAGLKPLLDKFGFKRINRTSLPELAKKFNLPEYYDERWVRDLK